MPTGGKTSVSTYRREKKGIEDDGGQSSGRGTRPLTREVQGKAGRGSQFIPLARYVSAPTASIVDSNSFGVIHLVTQGGINSLGPDGRCGARRGARLRR
jgi:hypothetical protein